MPILLVSLDQYMNVHEPHYYVKQDPLESFFGIMRSFGKRCNPTVNDAQYQDRIIRKGKYFNVPKNGNNIP